MEADLDDALPAGLALRVVGAKGMWVDLKRLRETDAAAADFVEAAPAAAKPAATITAVYGPDGQPTKIRKNARQLGAATFIAARIVNTAPSLAPRPALRLYHVIDRPFIPWELLGSWGVSVAERERLATTAYAAEVHNVRWVSGAIDFSAPRVTSIMFSAALVMRSLPATRQRVFDLFPGHQQPDLPGYAVDGTPEGSRWVSTADVRRACPDRVPDGDDTEVFAAMAPSGVKSKTLRYVKPHGGGLQAVKHPKDKHCHPFVSASWLHASFGAVVADADPALPVAFGVHPPNKGTKGAPKASKAPDVKNPKQTSVKCTVSCRLVDKRARAVLEDIVDNVTRASRFASHLINLHCIRLLDAGEGTLGADFVLDDKLFKECTSLAKDGSTAKGELLATMEAYGEQLAGGRFAYRQQGNASKQVSRACAGSSSCRPS